MSEGCGSLRLNVTSRSPLVVMLSTLVYHEARGLRRSLVSLLPATMSKVHLTSAAVNGFPSCHLALPTSLKMSCLPSALHCQLSARSGRIVSRLFCGIC